MNFSPCPLSIYKWALLLTTQGLHTMQIIVEQKSVYGTDKIYPVCKHAAMFAAIAGTTTLTPATVKLIQALGVEIALKPVTLEALL